MADEATHQVGDDGPTHAPAPAPWRRRPEVEVSVALCTFNGSRWIRPFLDSLVAQERRPDELVVIDDASSDDSVDVIERFAEVSPFPVRLEVNPSRVGSIANFAQVLERCRGRFLALADQDDVWYPAKLRRLVAELDEDPTLTLAFSDADLIGEDGRRLGRRLWDTRRVGDLLRRHPVVPEELFARRALTTGCTMVLRRRVVEAALPFPEVLQDPVVPMRHDRWLSLVAAAVGTVRALPEPMLGFRVHPAQETGVLIGRQLTAALRRSAAGSACGDSELHAAGLRARAAQLAAAAERAELLGDFGEAEVLRDVARGELLRSRMVTNGRPALSLLGEAVRAGAYRHNAVGAGAVAADVVRLVRRRLPVRGAP